MPDRDISAITSLRPGSPEAKRVGCICRAGDNPKESLGVWIRAGCPIHAPVLKPAVEPKG